MTGDGAATDDPTIARHRIRVIIDNDFSGDPDGLVQLAHQVLTPTTDVRLVIGSHLPIGHPFTTSTTTADDAATRASELLDSMGVPRPVVAGSNTPLPDAHTPAISAATQLIVAEAMRDSSLPLFMVCGASLTELASAYLHEPRIAERMTVVWIGGEEHPDAGGSPWPREEVEYNLSGDIPAAQLVVGDSELPLWLVPRDAYRQVMVSLDELETRMQPLGELGARLYAELLAVVHEVRGFGLEMGETFCLGDSPLALLTSLQSGFEPQPASSSSLTLPAPRIDDRGHYAAHADGRPIRVFTRLDTRLIVEDLLAKLAKHARAIP